jgi:hypothetical protein
VFGSYEGEPLSVRWFTGQYGGGDDRIFGMVGASGGKQPTDKVVRFSTSDDDPVLLEAAVAGTPGAFEEVELAGAIRSLIGDGEYVTPMLGGAGRELFVGVNLLAWLLNLPLFLEGDTFAFVDGVSAALPGVVVGTSPIVFSDKTGLTTADPYTGDARVIGISDGSSVPVPEPSSLTLMAVGLLGMLATWKIHKRTSV